MKRIVQIKRSRFFNSECNQLILLTQSSFPSLVRLTMETTVTAPRALYKGVGNTVALEKQGKAISQYIIHRVLAEKVELLQRKDSVCYPTIFSASLPIFSASLPL